MCYLTTELQNIWSKNWQKWMGNTSTLIVEDFNTKLQIMDKTTRQMAKKEREDLKNSIKQFNLTNIYRTFHWTIAEYTFFSRAHENSLAQIVCDAMKQASISFKRLRQLQVCSPTDMKLGIINNNEKLRKFINMWKLDSTNLNNQCHRSKKKSQVK